MRSRFIENCPGEADSKEDENNMNDTNLTIRPMTIDDFEQALDGDPRFRYPQYR